MQDTSKTYYSQNKLAVRARMKERRELLTNSEKYKEDFRNQLIENLNSGSTRYITCKTANKYKIALNPETLKYYYAGKDPLVKEELKFNIIQPEPIIDLTVENIIDVSQELTDIIAQSEELIRKLKAIVSRSKVIIDEPTPQQCILKLKEKEKKHQYYQSYKEMVDLYRATNNIVVRRGPKRDVPK